MEKDVITYSALFRIFISNLVGIAGGIGACFWIDNTASTFVVVSIPLSLATLTLLLVLLDAKDRTGPAHQCPTCGQPLPKPITKEAQ